MAFSAVGEDLSASRVISITPSQSSRNVLDSIHKLNSSGRSQPSLCAFLKTKPACVASGGIVLRCARPSKQYKSGFFGDLSIANLATEPGVIVLN